MFAIGWGAALLGEGVTGLMLAGGAVVLLGTALTLGYPAFAGDKPWGKLLNLGKAKNKAMNSGLFRKFMRSGDVLFRPVFRPAANEPSQKSPIPL